MPVLRLLRLGLLILSHQMILGLLHQTSDDMEEDTLQFPVPLNPHPHHLPSQQGGGVPSLPPVPGGPSLLSFPGRRGQHTDAQLQDHPGGLVQGVLLASGRLSVPAAENWLHLPACITPRPTADPDCRARLLRFRRHLPSDKGLCLYRGRGGFPQQLFGNELLSFPPCAAQRLSSWEPGARGFLTSPK